MRRQQNQRNAVDMPDCAAAAGVIQFSKNSRVFPKETLINCLYLYQLAPWRIIGEQVASRMYKTPGAGL